MTGRARTEGWMQLDACLPNQVLRVRGFVGGRAVPRPRRGLQHELLRKRHRARRRPHASAAGRPLHSGGNLNIWDAPDRVLAVFCYKLGNAHGIWKLSWDCPWSGRGNPHILCLLFMNCRLAGPTSFNDIVASNFMTSISSRLRSFVTSREQSSAVCTSVQVVDMIYKDQCIVDNFRNQ